MLNVDVMLGERQRSILGFDGGCELLFVYDLFPVSVVSQAETPVIRLLLHHELDIIVHCLVAVHESQYK